MGINKNDPKYAQMVAAAQQYRQQLGTQGIRFGNADAQVRQRFPGVDINDVRQQKAGGFAKIGGAVGDVVGKYVGPAVSMLNPGIGAALTAGGRLMGKMNDPGGLGGTKLFKEVGLPTAMSYGMGAATKGMGGFLKGGQAANPALANASTQFANPALTSTTGLLPAATQSLGTTAGGIGSSALGAAANQFAPVGLASKLLPGASASPNAVGSFLTGAGKWLASPNGLKAAEIGLNAYGAQQMGKAEDRMADLEEQGMHRTWNWEDAERERKRKVATQILAERQAQGV